MTVEFHPGDAVLFMKVGTHASEELSAIIARKQAEIEAAGYAMWGYGGNTCHPITMVRPFAEQHARPGSPIVLCMQKMSSNHFAQQVRAEEYSVDGLDWNEIPPAIDVLGSRYALCITKLRAVDTSIDLGVTRVAIGKSAGRRGSTYISGRVDKACLEVVANGEPVNTVPIGLVADMVPPYAVLLRNH